MFICMWVSIVDYVWGEVKYSEGVILCRLCSVVFCVLGMLMLKCSLVVVLIEKMKFLIYVIGR